MYDIQKQDTSQGAIFSLKKVATEDLLKLFYNIKKDKVFKKQIKNMVSKNIFRNESKIRWNHVFALRKQVHMISMKKRLERFDNEFLKWLKKFKKEMGQCLSRTLYIILGKALKESTTIEKNPKSVTQETCLRSFSKMWE